MHESVKEIHDEVENLPFSVALAEGNLTHHQKTAYLNNLWFIFQTLEHDIYRDLPHPDLHRCETIEQTLEEMGEELNGKWMTKGVEDYMFYILGAEDYKEKWSAHVYLNYMALMMGGQIVSKHNPEMVSLWDFNNRTECVNAIRELEWDWDQVYKGFTYHQRMLEELNNVG